MLYRMQAPHAALAMMQEYSSKTKLPAPLLLPQLWDCCAMLHGRLSLTTCYPFWGFQHVKDRLLHRGRILNE